MPQASASVFSTIKLQRRRATPLPNNSIQIFTLNCASPGSDKMASSENYLRLFHLPNDINFIVDTASPKSLLPAQSYLTQADPYKSARHLFGPYGRSLQTFCSIDLILSFAYSPHQIKHKFFVVDVNKQILGLDVLHKLGLVMDLSTNLICFRKQSNLSINQSHI